MMNDVSTGWWVLMGVGMFAVWALIVWVVVVMLRDRFGDRDARMASDILDERLARGEISVEEFERRRSALRNAGPAAPSASR